MKRKIVSALTDRRLLMVLLLIALSSAAMAQGTGTYKTFSEAATTATTTLRTNIKSVLEIVQIICAGVSIFSLGWALWRRNKGDGQSNDAIMTVFISLIVVMIIMEVVKTVWL